VRLGVRLRENFDSPYGATSITESWRRWHISLSSWLRDYLYIPFGGNRRGRARRTLNLLLTMLLGGLWHGASWTFVAWGGLHGLALAARHLMSSRVARPGPWRRALGWLLTFHLVAALWVLFRASSFEQAGQVFAGLLSGWDLSRLAMVLGVRRWLVVAVGVGLGLGLAPTRWQQWLESRFGRVPWPAQAMLLVGVLAASELLSGTEVALFIYFQF
jgi:alginate O-acetyltransferase complex protein AlgI